MKFSPLIVSIFILAIICTPVLAISASDLISNHRYRLIFHDHDPDPVSHHYPYHYSDTARNEYPNRRSVSTTEQRVHYEVCRILLSMVSEPTGRSTLLP